MEDKIYKRKLAEKICEYLSSKKAIVIYGARQTGKTTLLKYIIQNHIKENAFYFDLELSNLLAMCNEGAESVYRYLQQKGANEKKKIYLIIDEVQYLEDPSKFIKILHDHYPGVKLIVSGSSTFEIKRKFNQSLAGRIIAFELYPLNFEEFLIFKDREYKFAKENAEAINRELIDLADEYIRYGGYPEIVLEDSEDKKYTYLSQIINTYIRKDIRDIGNIRNIASFNKLLDALASQSAQLLNISELANTLGIRRETVMEYLGLLESTFIIKIIRPFHKNLRSELSKNPKVFLTDTGMMHLLWLKEFPKIVHGSVFETFVFLELIKAGKDIRFWRTTNKQEIDFVLPGKEVYAIEAKYKFSKPTKSMAFFRNEYKCKTFLVGLKGKRTGKYVWELLKELGG